MKLTKKQLSVLKLISLGLGRTGLCNLLRRHDLTIWGHTTALKQQGLLVRSETGTRGLKLTKAGRKAVRALMPWGNPLAAFTRS